jgi:SAM-dependent methyltransferase
MFEMAAQARNLAAFHPDGGSPFDSAIGAQADAAVVTAWITPATHPTIIDFGVGYGRVAEETVRWYDRVVGVDPWPSVIRLAGQRVPGLALVRSDGLDLAARLPTPADAAYAFDVFPRMPARIGGRVLRGLAAAVRPGGLLLVDVPTEERRRDPADWTDRGAWSEAFLDGVLGQAGLEEDIARGILPPGMLLLSRTAL